MKDALGHGSFGSGDGAVNIAAQLRARLGPLASLKGGGVPMSSNRTAGAALMGTLRATQAPASAASPATYRSWTGTSSAGARAATNFRNKGTLQ